MSIYDRKCLHCNKTMNHANNLEKHLRRCEKASTHPAKPELCQTTLDGSTLFENGTSAPKKLMVEKVLVGSAPAEHIEHCKSAEIVESTLKDTALTFRKASNFNNKRDVLQRLKAVIHSMGSVIEGQAQANVEAVKWYLSLNMYFYKSTSPIAKTDMTAMFRSEVFKSIDTHELVLLPSSCRI